MQKGVRARVWRDLKIYFAGAFRSLNQHDFGVDRMGSRQVPTCCAAAASEDV